MGVWQVGVHDVDGAIDGNKYHVDQALLVCSEVHLDVALLFGHEVGTCTLSELCSDCLGVGVRVVQDSHVGITIHDVQHVLDRHRVTHLVGQDGIAVVLLSFLQVVVVEQGWLDGRTTDLELADCRNMAYHAVCNRSYDLRCLYGDAGNTDCEYGGYVGTAI